jgi:hypothetical protein
MENPRMVEAFKKLGDWIMAHPGYSFGPNSTNTEFRFLKDEKVIDSEPCTCFQDSESTAMAIERLLLRHP